MALQLGAKRVLSQRPKELVSEVAELAGTRIIRPWRGLPWLLDGMGIVYDTVGSPATVETAIRLVRPHGKVVISGVEAPQRFEWTPLYFKEVAIVGSNAFGHEPFRGENPHAFSAYLQLAAEGLDLSRLVTHQYRLSEWQRAFSTLLNKGTTRAVKVAFRFD
jgi:threonine dehydrogenase-like Zn-dependent dehydrogenase